MTATSKQKQNTTTSRLTYRWTIQTLAQLSFCSLGVVLLFVRVVVHVVAVVVAVDVVVSDAYGE